jgi:hypothetical protein
MSTPPLTQHGKIKQRQPMSSNLGIDLGWNQFIDTQEYVPVLKWPQSVTSYDTMRTDSQLSALYRAVTLPPRRYHWMLHPNGADTARVNRLADNLNLPVVDAQPRPRGRMKGRFSFYKHLYEAFLSGIYGHSYFEQVGPIAEDGLWSIKKLFYIPPTSIAQINVADDGGLISIKQKFNMGLYQPTELEVDRLAVYVNEQEGGSWVGRSWYRDCYRNWLIKDRLLRVDAINHERAGGVPIGTAAPGASPTEIQALARAAQGFKVSEDGGAAIPAGSKIDLLRLGAGTDVVGSIRYHDEAMSRVFLQMVIELGMTETGSRALGESFGELAHGAQLTIADGIRDTFNEHVIEDYWDWNYTDNSNNVPYLVYIVEQEHEDMSIEDLALAVNRKLIRVDDELEAYLRERFKLPKAGTPRVDPQPDPIVPGNSPVEQEVAARARVMMLALEQERQIEQLEEARLSSSRPAGVVHSPRS